MILMFFVISCGKNKKEVKNLNTKEMEPISFTVWKESLENIQNLTDFQKKNLQYFFDKVNNQTFEKIIKSTPIKDIEDRFFVLVYSEDETVVMTLNYFMVNKIFFKRVSLKIEYGKITLSENIVYQPLNYSDFKSISENEFEYSGFLFLTEIAENNELISTINKVSETFDKYLY